MCRCVWPLMNLHNILTFFPACYFIPREICSNAKALSRSSIAMDLFKAKKKLNYDDMMTTTSECVLDILKISFCDDMRFMLWSVNE